MTYVLVRRKVPRWRPETLFYDDYQDSLMDIVMNIHTKHHISRWMKTQEQKSGSLKKQMTEEDICPICHDVLGEVECHIVQTDCGHVFCKCCIEDHVSMVNDFHMWYHW